jgi:hypothetical protein
MNIKHSARSIALGLLVLAVSVLSSSSPSAAQIALGISVRVGPPALPVYAQPVCPGPGYLWTPGYWAWNDVSGYYWVPGTWVVAPAGMLWTPGYWGWREGVYVWHPGYWGPHVGFYGGINYGFGYTGVGFVGGEWRGRSFFYNRSVVNVVNVTNVYSRTVVVNNVRHVSFNGPGGIEARPTRQEEEFAREPHREALSMQFEHEHAAGKNRMFFASENHGRPEIAATGRPGEFNGRHIERAREAGEPYHAPRMTPEEARGRPEGDHRFNESNRDRGNFGDHGTAHPEDHEHHVSWDKSEQKRQEQEARRQEHEAQHQQHEAQKQEHEAQKMEHQAQKQERAEQKHSEKENRSQSKAEPKHNPHDQHR